jgi:putative ABC transport system substrate-binding protein
MIQRRDFLAILGGAAVGTLSAPFPSGAVARNRPLIGFLSNGDEAGNGPLGWFLDGMSKLGYVRGKGFDIVARFSGVGADDRLPELAKELVLLQPDLIFATSAPVAVAAKRATSSIPIVVGTMFDPIGLGLVTSEARPGGNVTGMLEAPAGLPSKELQLAMEVAPDATTIGYLNYSDIASELAERHEIEAAAAARSRRIVVATSHSSADLQDAIRSLADQSARVVIVGRSTLFFINGGRIAELATAARLASIFCWPQPVASGGLVGYGVDIAASFRHTAMFVDKIFKGAKPADLPVEFPTTLVMAINLKTAKTLGLTVPQSLLVAADQVIQ